MQGMLYQSMLYWPMPNVLYVEGCALDRFAEGFWALEPVHQNKVGLVLDSGVEEDLRLHHLQVVGATRASLGLPVIEYTVTDAALQHISWWKVGRPQDWTIHWEDKPSRLPIKCCGDIGREIWRECHSSCSSLPR